MDLIEIANANGYKYILIAMEVFSKYAFAVPLTAATAVAVTEAVVHHITPHGVGRPLYSVLDGGPEFKDVFIVGAGSAGMGSDTAQVKS